jgi:hypothetical protein
MMQDCNIMHDHIGGIVERMLSTAWFEFFSFVKIMFFLILGWNWAA